MTQASGARQAQNMPPLGEMRERQTMADRQDIHNSSVPRICMSCEARHNGICGVLDDTELLELANQSVQTQHTPGEELIGDAEDVDSYATVLRGVVKLTKILEDGRQQVVGLQFAPDFLGRLFAKQSALNAESASDVRLCRLPKTTLENMVRKNPALEARLFEQTLRELDEARDWMVTLGRKNASEKVASFLYLIASHADPSRDLEDQEGSVTFDLPLSRSDIADFLGLTIETVSRQMTKMRSAKIIEVENHRHIHVKSAARLRALCG